jgi:hypothetical protein
MKILFSAFSPSITISLFWLHIVLVWIFLISFLKRGLSIILITLVLVDSLIFFFFFHRGGFLKTLRFLCDFLMRKVDLFAWSMFISWGEIGPLVQKVYRILYVTLNLVHFAVNECESLEYLVFYCLLLLDA